MKSIQRQDKRRLKINKIRKDKKLKNKKKINHRLKEKTVNTERGSVSFSCLFSKKTAMTAGILAVVAYLFLLNPTQSNRTGLNHFEKMSQTTPIAEAADFSSESLDNLSLIATNSIPLAKGETYEQIMSIVKGTPMEQMAEAISNRDRIVAAFMVGIGMKESKFGIYSPKKNGKECYNYWGYRGKENTTASGYSCFDSPGHAVKVVGDRIQTFVDQGRETPEQMIIWKCGYSCAGHTSESVNKWIKDVSIHYQEIMQAKQIAKINR